jgi:drug/metabolite transporter (DMT)-like permease
MGPKALSLVDILLLFGYTAALSLGQILFKMASGRVQDAGGTALLVRLFTSPSFLTAGALYAGLAVYWTWLLARVPLSYAFPFVALCFVFVPAMAWIRFGERVGSGYGIGLVLIIAGLLVIGLNAPR